MMHAGGIGGATSVAPTAFPLTPTSGTAIVSVNGVVLIDDAAGVLALKNGATAQMLRVYESVAGAMYATITHASGYAQYDTVGGTGAIFGSTTGKEYYLGNHAACKLSFYGATPQLKQASGENLTNNITSGGVDGTLTTWSNLSTYSTDAAAIRNAVYQLGRKLKQVNDALRLYGLLT